MSLKNPITGIQIVFLDDGLFKTKDYIPKNYNVIYKTLNDRKADLNRGSGGRDIYISYTRKTTNKPITKINAVFIDNGKSYDADAWNVIKKTPSGNTADLNKDSGGNDIYMVYQKTKSAPITDVGVLSFKKNEEILLAPYTSDGWVVVEKNLNRGSGGNTIYMCYKRQQYNYKNYTVAGLVDICASLNIVVPKNYRRRELIKAIENHM